MSTLLTGFGIVLAAVLLIGLALWINQMVAIRRVRNDFPAPGKLFTVQGRAMHLNCSGSMPGLNAPTIVIDAGNGSYSLDWSNIQHRLASSYRVCTYDRPGYGWSELSRSPRDADHIVEELHSLLQAAGEPGPYLLIGHSLGGLHMQLYTARYPDEVAGLLLVESPGANLQNDAAYQQQAQITTGTYKTMRFLTASGLLRVLGPLIGSQTLPAGAASLPAREQEVYVQLLLDPRHYETALAEKENNLRSAEQLKAALEQSNHPFGDLPLIVLTAGMIDVPEGNNPFATRRIPVEPGVIAQQADLATLSTQGKRQIVPNSGHLMQHDDPEAILKAINDLIHF